MDFDENDVASQLYRTALKDHGIPHRYEESLTRNGLVTWRPSRGREVLGKSSDAEEEQKPARRFRNALGIVW